MRSAVVLAITVAIASSFAPRALAEELSKKPSLTRFVEAPPPPTLAAHGRVEVVLTLDVDAAGHVTSVAVAQPGPPGEGYDQAALAAARQFVFTPGEAHGQPVPVRITYQYVFLYKPPPEPLAPPPPPVDTVPVAGRVLSRGERVPLAGVSVILDGGELATTTDGDGRFRFDAVRIGPHQLKLRGVGLTATENPLALSRGKSVDVTYYVPSKTRYSTTVRAQRAVEETVEHTISAEELKRIPGTQGDTLKAVQNLPGLARSPFGAGLLIVWGSSPFDTRVYADGVFIPTLYHFGGLRSTVNSEIVESLTFTPGGYGVEHGRGLGGVVEVESRRPRKDGYHGFAQLDLIDASLMVEGKLAKNLELAIGVRRSTIDAWLPYVTPNDFQLTPTYWDYQAKLHWKASARDDLDVFVFGSDDLLHLTTQNPDPNLTFAFDSHIYYHRALARWTHKFAGKATLAVTGSLGYDVPFQFRGTTGNFPISVDAETFEYSLRAVARVPLWSWLRLDGGIDFEGNRATITGQTPVSGQPREGDPGNGGGGGRASGYVTTNAVINTNYFAPFLAANFRFFGKRLAITPQLRFDVLNWAAYQNSPDAYSYSYALWEPRLAARFQIVKWAALKGAIGIYHQPIDPTTFLVKLGNPRALPELAVHYVFGADFDPTPTLHIEVEGFYKDLRAMQVRGRQGEPPITNEGEGRVYGGELLVRQELWKNFFGWVAYTASRSERRDHSGDPWRIFQFDQTHILTLIASYKLPRGYQVGFRFRYVTGNPFTATVSPFGYFDANTGGYRAIYGQPYSSRLADFHQLDVRFDKAWTFNRWRLAAYLDIQNLYNNRSPEGMTYNFDFRQSTVVAGLPIIPDLGLRGEF